jgi:predicted helicase
MSHLLTGENLALCTHRIIRNTTTWQHVWVTNGITEGNCVSNKDGPTHVFPLYLYPSSEGLALSTECSLNLKPVFLKALLEALGLPQTDPFGLPQGISPEEILGYMYAVLYSPTYRERYYEFLKYDFPRIPLPTDIEYFRKLAELGQNLINWHLLKDMQIPPRHRFEGEGEAVVSKVRYENEHIWINPTQHFTDVPEAVWEYEIGTYQVCEKWLRDRRGSTLSHAEVRQYCGILVAIAETLRIMGEIDKVVEFQEP